MLSRSTTASCLLKLVLVLAVLACAADALKCYQGQQSSQTPFNGSAAECPFTALSCLKQEDSNSKLVIRSCQASNCTFNGMQSVPTCQNTSQYPFQQWCCCYGD